MKEALSSRNGSLPVAPKALDVSRGREAGVIFF